MEEKEERNPLDDMPLVSDWRRNQKRNRARDEEYLRQQGRDEVLNKIRAIIYNQNLDRADMLHAVIKLAEPPE